MGYLSTAYEILVGGGEGDGDGYYPNFTKSLVLTSKRLTFNTMGMQSARFIPQETLLDN